MANFTTQQVIEQFGPITRINREREEELIQEGKGNHILTLIGTDTGFHDLPANDRPSFIELAYRGESEEDYSRTVFSASVGRKIVNVEEIFETSKPMPSDLEMQDDDIDFGDGGLPLN